MTPRIASTRVALRDLPVLADIGINSHEIGRLQLPIVTIELEI